MNRKKLAALVSLVATVVIGSVTYSVYLPDPDTALAGLADAGAGTPTHALTCAVRVSSECQARFGVGRYERVRFGVAMPAAVAGERDVLLPPLGGVRRCVEMIDFKRCTSTPCVSAAAVCAKFGNANPFTLAPADRECGRKNTARGFSTCRFSAVAVDAGWGTLGEMNVYPSAQLTGNCEPLALPTAEDGTCYVFAGDRAEDL